jgi:hypothetical protein
MILAFWLCLLRAYEAGPIGLYMRPLLSLFLGFLLLSIGPIVWWAGWKMRKIAKSGESSQIQENGAENYPISARVTAWSSLGTIKGIGKSAILPVLVILGFGAGWTLGKHQLSEYSKEYSAWKQRSAEYQKAYAAWAAKEKRP